jgi:DUF971 family protein
LLKVHDLPRKSRLRNAQSQRRFRNRAQFRYSDERSQAPQVHTFNVCLIGIRFQNNYALDISFDPGHIVRTASLNDASEHAIRA